MTKCLTISAALFVLVVGCSSAARDKLKHWFFDIPAPADSSAATPAEPAAASPPLIPPTPTTRVRFASVHEPFVRKRCDACHSAEQHMGVHKDALASCRTCHARYFSEQVGHAPVAGEQCAECHEMHRSVETALLKKPVFDMCVECHDEPDSLSPGAHRGENVRQCTTCHDAHFGADKLLKPGVSKTN